MLLVVMGALDGAREGERDGDLEVGENVVGGVGLTVVGSGVGDCEVGELDVGDNVGVGTPLRHMQSAG
jgi:hypothetical protein